MPFKNQLPLEISIWSDPQNETPFAFLPSTLWILIYGQQTFQHSLIIVASTGFDPPDGSR